MGPGSLPGSLGVQMIVISGRRIKRAPAVKSYDISQTTLCSSRLDNSWSWLSDINLDSTRLLLFWKLPQEIDV